jgi:hypothetical protein
MDKKVGFKKEKISYRNLRKRKNKIKLKWSCHGIKISKSLLKNLQMKQGNLMQSSIVMKVLNKTILLKTMISIMNSTRSTS